MKREITVGSLITKDDSEKLNRKLREWEDKVGKRITMSTFIYEALIKPYLSDPEIREEDPPLEQTTKTQSIPDSEPPRRDPFNFDPL